MNYYDSRFHWSQVCLDNTIMTLCSLIYKQYRTFFVLQSGTYLKNSSEGMEYHRLINVSNSSNSFRVQMKIRKRSLKKKTLYFLRLSSEQPPPKKKKKFVVFVFLALLSYLVYARHSPPACLLSPENAKKLRFVTMYTRY